MTLYDSRAVPETEDALQTTTGSDIRTRSHTGYRVENKGNSMTRVGGRKRRAWRLKKKYDKWFMWSIEDLLVCTLKELPQGMLEQAFRVPG